MKKKTSESLFKPRAPENLSDIFRMDLRKSRGWGTYNSVLTSDDIYRGTQTLLE